MRRFRFEKASQILTSQDRPGARLAQVEGALDERQLDDVTAGAGLAAASSFKANAPVTPKAIIAILIG